MENSRSMNPTSDWWAFIMVITLVLGGWLFLAIIKPFSKKKICYDCPECGYNEVERKHTSCPNCNSNLIWDEVDNKLLQNV
jgi:predicted RNA-binding Zn-ribbon protein involved in translation (DUF1610 family)